MFSIPKKVLFWTNASVFLNGSLPSITSLGVQLLVIRACGEVERQGGQRESGVTVKIATVRRLLPQLRAISSSSFDATQKHQNLTAFVGAIYKVN